MKKGHIFMVGETEGEVVMYDTKVKK